jgi:hypothetical protein
MNRKERRRAAKLRAIPVGVLTSLGRIAADLGAFEVHCHMCGTQAAEWEWEKSPTRLGYGVARIVTADVSDSFLICRSCFENGDETENAIVCKYLGLDGLKVTKASPQQQAIYDRR